TPLNGNNSASSKESNWVADFMVGRDIGVGSGSAQIKGGLRVAEIRGTTNGNIALATTFFIPETSNSSYTQSNFFFGVGPRLAIEGNAPISGPWSVEYAAGIAELFAHRSSTQSAANGTGFPSCIANCPIS